jgi:hypothetical protein
MEKSAFSYEEYYKGLIGIGSYRATGITCPDCGVERYTDGTNVICYCGSGDAIGFFAKPKTVQPIKRLC